MSTNFLKVKNNALSSLASGITNSATSLSVVAGEGSRFPSDYPFHVSIDDEILECSNRSTDTLTVSRSAESTSAVAHSAGAPVALTISAQTITDLQDGKARTATLVVAASNATTNSKLGADYVCDGTADNVEIQAAITALSAGQKLYITAGTYNLIASLNFNKVLEVECESGTNFVASAGMTEVVLISTGSNYGKFKFGTINGASIASIVGIKVQNTNLIDSYASQISGCAIGISLDATDNNLILDNNIEVIGINANAGIGIQIKSGSLIGGSLQGNLIEWNFITNALKAINIEQGATGVTDGNVFKGTAIDCVVASSFGIYLKDTPGANWFEVAGWMGGSGTANVGGNSTLLGDTNYAAVNGYYFALALQDNKFKLTGVGNTVVNRVGQQGHAGAATAAVTASDESSFNSGVPLYANRMVLSCVVPAMGIGGLNTFYFYSTLLDRYDAPKVSLISDGGESFIVSVSDNTGTVLREGTISVRPATVSQAVTITVVVELY